MKNFTLPKSVTAIIYLALGAIIGGYVVYQSYTQIVASVTLNGKSYETYVDTKILMLLKQKKTEKAMRVLCVRINSWPTLYNDIKKYHIEKGIIPTSTLKYIPYIKEALPEIEENNKRIIEAINYCSTKKKKANKQVKVVR